VRAAEQIAAEYGISRLAADEFSVRSHRRAAAARAEGRFEDEVVPVRLGGSSSDTRLVDQDEGICECMSVEGLASYRPWLSHGVVTPGNASRHSDAAAACLVVAEDQLVTLRLDPIASIVGWAAVGCHPDRAGMGAVSAVERLLRRTGLQLPDMDLIEINEAFACEVLAVLHTWNWHDEARINVNGSGISLGHPVGATGARIMCTLLHELRRRQGRFALETLRVAGGQGIAAVFERL
jgi:acetyl-CoA C-acetyltransferase